ncbi:MAG: hypothetical protein KDB53_17570, partial [Planctomycetes bacterium]|nr:hypothetical protein [Planctomycetota bacterium]
MTTIGPAGSSRFSALQFESRIDRPARAAAASPGSGIDDIARLRDAIGSAQKRIAGLSTILERGRVGQQLGLAQTGSALSLGLNLTPTQASLESTGEVNAIATSYGPTAPAFRGSSTSSPTLTGTYDGSLGDESLTFRVSRAGLVGSVAPLQLEVRDSSGTLIDTIDAPGFTPANTELATSFGLSVSLSSGILAPGDEFDVDVSASIGSAVDPDRAFNGTGNAAPGFEPGFSVTAGSFELNGQTVTVAADDSISSVIGKINALGAGVTAAFESGSETIRLTADAAGSSQAITLGNDDSGFLAATKLAAAVATPGLDDERTVALQDVPGFSGVSAGTFGINGSGIAIDPAVDSLNDLIARVNDAKVGASLAFNAGSGSVRFAATSASSPLVLADGGTGLLAALQVEAGTLESAPGARRLRGVDDERLREELTKLGEDLDEIFKTAATATGRVEQNRLRTRIRTSVGEIFDAAPSTKIRGGRFMS